jgi:Spy/CpxP family protein refolding chaperone
MRRSAIALVLFGFLAVAALPAAAQQSDEDNSAETSARRAEALERIELVRLYKLVELLELNSDQSARLFPIFQKYDHKFRDIVEKKEQSYEAMTAELQSPTPDAKKLGVLSDTIVAMDDMAMKTRIDQYNELKKYLSPMQMAKFLLFEKKFHKEMNRILDEIRGRRPPPSQKPKQ